MSTNSPERHTVVYSGRVQGVGFRYTTCAIARGHEVSGYVRNCPDGRVELVAEGTPRELEEFLRDIRDRMSHHIRDERRDVQQASGEFTGFEIRR